MAKRHRNDGLRKLCDCKRDRWSDCAHPWHFSYKWAGVHHRFSLDRHLKRRITSKSVAITEARRLKTEIEDGTFGRPVPALATLTVQQLLDTYERDELAKRPGGVRKNITYQIAAIVAPVLRLPTGESRKFGEWLVVDVTTAALEQYRVARQAPETVVRKGRGARRVGGPSAVNRALSFLRAVFNWAIRSGYVDATPFKRAGVTVIRLGREQKRSRRLQEGEEARLLSACSPHLHNLVVAALESGMRLGELLGLQWSEVSLREVRPEIRLAAGRTKTRMPRTIPISTRLKAILEMRHTDPADEPLPSTGYVFGNEVGQRVGSIKTAWRAACRRAGIENLHFHDLRREAGSRWLDGGVKTHEAQAWLGHTNVAQTSTYLATTAKTSHDAMQRFDQIRLQPLATNPETPGQSGADGAGTVLENTPESTPGHTTH